MADAESGGECSASCDVCVFRPGLEHSIVCAELDLELTGIRQPKQPKVLPATCRHRLAAVFRSYSESSRLCNPFVWSEPATRLLPRSFSFVLHLVSPSFGNDLRKS